jgi:hypothetical protein
LAESRTDPGTYVKRNFPIAVRERGQPFIEEAAEVISHLPDLPCIASFYVLFDRRDSPIRIDLPYWDQRLSENGWHRSVALDLTQVLKVLATGYCGLDCHNLWLKNVDEKVRLKRRTVDNIYFPYMEKLFETKIIRGRSYRRVKFP